MSRGGSRRLADQHDARLAQQPFLCGGEPGAADAELFEQMLGRGNTHVHRWVRHLASYPAPARAAWPAAAPRAAAVVASVGARAAASAAGGGGAAGGAEQLRREIAAIEDRLVTLQRELRGETEQPATDTRAKGGKKGAKKGKEPVIELQPEQGCRDFPPEEMRLRRWLFAKFRAVAAQYGFEEYDAPVLEAEQLYVVKAGQGKEKAGEDILNDMYTFVTKGGHRVALRPEMTPTLARLVMQKGQALLTPVKWFSLPQCWRYEAIVRGRRREHYQWNMDIIGVKSVSAEAELIAAIVALLSSCGLTAADVGIKVNSRKLLQTVLERAGVGAAQFAPVCVIVDKIDKLERADIEEMLREQGLSDQTITEVLGSLSLSGLDQMRARVGAESEVVRELEELWGYFEAYGVADWVVFDASVVRGLAYYTGVVFECFDRDRKLRAICGGGRYDNLFKTFGHTTIHPACGFGFGDCVIVELLKDKGLLPDLGPEVQDLVIPFDESMRPHAVTVLSQLRAAGRRADMVLERKRSPKQAFSYADRIGATRAVFVAPDEWAEGRVRVKMLREGAGHANPGEKDRGEAMTVGELIARSAAPGAGAAGAGGSA